MNYRRRLQVVGWGLLGRASDIRPHEARATLASFSLVMMLMASYYILRPVRDAMASDWSGAEVSWLWTFTFFISFIESSTFQGCSPIDDMNPPARPVRPVVSRVMLPTALIVPPVLLPRPRVSTVVLNVPPGVCR